METAAKLLFIGGIALIVMAGLFWALAKTGIDSLPGNLSWSSGNVSVYVPIASMLILSLILTVVLNVFLRLFR
jgi:hypothetical protein